MSTKIWPAWGIIGNFLTAGSGKERHIKQSRCLTMSVIIIALLLSGCIDNGIVGKYVSMDSNETYFDLYDDGTFIYHYSHNDIPSESGTYKVVDDKLLMTFQPWGVVVSFSPTPSGWIREKGDTYVKQ